jgi:transposase InsO family protein
MIINHQTTVMAYTTNPYLPKVRRMAVNDVVVRDLSHADVARRYGVHRSTVGRWVKRASPDRKEFIHTLPSRPKSHPNQLDPALVARVIKLRKELGRCAPVLHEHLKREGVIISLSSVARILKRHGLTRKPKRPTYDGKNPRRPQASRPGELVQADTMHVMRKDYSRYYVYALIDIYSRFGYAEYKLSSRQIDSLSVIANARKYCGFNFDMIQTDNGAEFKTTFKYRLMRQRMKLRHSRVRRPNDNAHVERFIRTIQEECFKSKPPRERAVNRQLKEYLVYYNYQRLHLGINLKTPAQMLQRS